MQISFVMPLFSDQISGRGKSFQGEQTASGGRSPCPPVEESQDGKVNFGQNSEILGLHFCANTKLCTELAVFVNCLKIIDFSIYDNSDCFKFDYVTLS